MYEIMNLDFRFNSNLHNLGTKGPKIAEAFPVDPIPVNFPSQHLLICRKIRW